ncbi:hypothetical protein Nepgr_023968 [Nepenthes gracilis]|uniref:Uncharacterized protein n=1 Tax=Nepenthes gracilis TaxID=150966 RepID=A0AAD3XZL3_NEPGR|nr:hypothetical protein Nepgr_023968 [Nepenthes gracilis]
MQVASKSRWTSRWQQISITNKPGRTRFRTSQQNLHIFTDPPNQMLKRICTLNKPTGAVSNRTQYSLQQARERKSESPSGQGLVIPPSTSTQAE